MSEPGPQGQPDDALVDLLIKQVTEGLSPAEQRALDALDSPVATQYLRDFERAAAAINMAGAGPLHAPPAALRASLEDQGRRFLAERQPLAGGASGPRPMVGVTAPTAAMPLRSRATRSGAAAWLAAAACLVLALVGWLRPPPAAVVSTTGGHEAHLAPPATPADERAALLAQATTLKVDLSATQDPGAAGVTGDVVWDPATQKGFLHFVGLAQNDANVLQYQIWIFDAARDQRYPIDGGVFDVPADSRDIVIPIRAAVLVHQPAAFAVTAEKPGGVVVSDRAHVLALGKAG